MDSLLRSRRSLRPPSSSRSDSNNSLVGIPADIIVALRTASFSHTSNGDIEAILRETEAVLGRSIPGETKMLIRERYHSEGANLSKLLLAWLKETLGESEGSMSLSINDLSSIFAGADKIAGQMISGDTELSPVSAQPAKSDRSIEIQSAETSTENPSSVVRRQWAAAFKETARVVSQKQLRASPLRSSAPDSFRFDPSLVADDLNQIFADASKMYILPLVASSKKPATNAPQDYGTTSNNRLAANTRASNQNASIAETNNLIDDLIRDYKSSK